MEALIHAVARHARERGDEPALIAGEAVVSYRRLFQLAAATSARLEAQGAGPGDRVVLIAKAGDPWFVVAYLALHFLRAVAVPLDAGRPAGFRERVRALVSPIVVLDEVGLASLQADLESLAEARCDREPATPSPDDPAEILFTSGTTGTPKGVLLTHGNIANSTRNIVEFVGNLASDRELITIPLGHSFGLGRLRANLTVGGTAVLVPGLRFPALIFRTLGERAITGMSCVPSGIALLMRVAGERFGELMRSLRYMELGSERMAQEAKRNLMQAMPRARLCMHYGLTEASRSAFLSFHDDAAKLESVGRAAPRVSIGIRDDAGRELQDGETGRICVRAATVTPGYWHDPNLTAARVDAEGWLDTGDLGYRDAGGYLHLRGRADDVINVGGRKVYPAQVEEAALAFGGVVEAACVGLPDPSGLADEVPMLFAVKRSGEDVDDARLLCHLASRLELHAVPREVRWVTALPRTESGKLQRAALRAASAGS